MEARGGQTPNTGMQPPAAARPRLMPRVSEQGPKGKQTMTSEVTALLGPGDRAPNLVLPAVNQDGTISFEDYWLKGWLLLGLFRGVF